MDRQIPVFDRTIRELVKELPLHSARPVNELTPEEARSSLLLFQSHTIQRTDVETKDWSIGSEVGNLRLRTFHPRNVGDHKPGLLYFHGGGWVLGDATTHDRLVRALAAGAEATVVFLEYDRAPEQQYPIAVEQAYAAMKYVSEHAKEFGISSAHLAVAGESSGGNIAAVVSLLAKQRSGPRLAGQALFYPATNADFETESYQQFADGPWLTRAGMQWFWDQYLPERSRRTELRASPLQASLDQLAGLPPALVITAEIDVLRDGGEAYGRKLMEAGVEVVATRYNGTIHDFMLINRLADAAPARAAVAQAAGFLRKILAPSQAAS